jgi:ectoine hydroxylase-related dioxygenase (phytanoyl-CoA dioxygenase family)
MSLATLTQPNDLMTQAHIDQYREEGYAIVRNVFSPAEVQQMRTALDRWHFMALLLGRTWRKQNTVIWVDQENGSSVVRGMQWPSYHDAVMDHFRTDPRLLTILSPLIGENIKQIINQVHWKRPGSRVTWPLHRDVRSRKPDSDFFELPTSWVQTGIAIDPHLPENGAMNVVPGSHKDVIHDPADAGIWNVPQYEKDPRIKPMALEPGDVALWSAYTVHGGGFNPTKYLDRRLYINGYIKAEKCLRGEWAWREGRTVHLHGQPALIQFDEVHKYLNGFYAEELGRLEKVID